MFRAPDRFYSARAFVLAHHCVNFETLQLLAVEFEALHFSRVESQSVFLRTSFVVASAVVVVDVIRGGFPNDFSLTAFALELSLNLISC